VEDLRVVGGRADQANVERLLRALPEWFGIEDSLLGYIAEAGTLPGYLAYIEGGSEGVGVLLLKRHFPHAAEVHLMAVTPALHRRGVGRALLAAAEADLRSDGVRLLQVKTLGPSRPDDGYRRTLAFYRAQGFIPLEEIDGLWPGNPCLILVKSLSG
jgi:GNAT superfamily N-acetyltransferase